MVINTKTILFIGLLVCGVNFLSAANYYFSSVTGDDFRTAQIAGNPATPWKSIDKLNQVADQLLPGDTVFFKRGEVFFGGIILMNSGTADNPIVFSAYGQGPKPVISGFHTVQTWTSLGNGIYQSNSLPTGALVNMVLLDGRNYPMGRYPNADADNKGYLSFESHTAGSITDNELSGTINWTGAELVVRTRRWVLDRLLITQQNGQTLSYEEGSTRYPLYDGYGYFIQGHIRTLDQFGEWYYDADTRKIAVYFGNLSPTNVDVQVTAVDLLLRPDVSHVSFQNLSFQGANEWAVFNDKSGREGVRFIQTDFAFIGGNAIEFAGMGNLTISGCSFTDINNLGIDLFYRNPNALIENNVFQNIGVQAGMGKSGNATYGGIFSTGDGAVIRDNRMTNIGYSGIDFSGNNIVVENNFVDTFCTTLDDGAGIYTFGGNATFQNQSIIRNIVLNGKGSPEGTVSREGYYPAEGIYLDDNAADVEVAYNTVATTGNAGIFIHNANSFNIHDNTVFNCAVQLATANDDGGASIRNGVIENNIFFGRTSEQLLARHLSVDNDIDEMGQMDYNYYARPFKEVEVISAVYNTNISTIREVLDLNAWKDRHPYDQNSWKSPVDLPEFAWQGDPDATLIDNGNYDTNILGASCYAASGDCAASWVNNGILDNGALEISSSATGLLLGLIQCDPVDQSNQYVLRFSAAASQDVIMNIYLGQSIAPYSRLSENIPIRIGTQRKEYELLIPYPVSSTNCRILFETTDVAVTYWLDNVALFPVNASPVDPNEVFRFEYNDTKTNKIIDLGATSYLDVRNQSYSGQLVLEPFTSIILIRDPDQNNGGTDPICVDLNLWVYLEGSLIVPQTGLYQTPMRTTLNDSRLLPGQFSENVFTGNVYTKPLGAEAQVYNIAPWNYSGVEGSVYDSGGSGANADAGYPETVTDWVLVSLRSDPNNGSDALCRRAGLLHRDGRIEFLPNADCCQLDPSQDYHIVIEHRNHLIVMSHEAVPVVNGMITYDFRNQQSFLNDPLNSGIILGQKEVLPGVFAMYAGNGDQTTAGNEDTDLTAADNAKWLDNGPSTRTYNLIDYNLDGDVSSLDFQVWQSNSPGFTSVPRE